MRHALDFGNPSTEELLRWMLYAGKSVKPPVRELRGRLAAELVRRLQTDPDIPFVNLVGLGTKTPA